MIHNVSSWPQFILQLILLSLLNSTSIFLMIVRLLYLQEKPIFFIFSLQIFLRQICGPEWQKNLLFCISLPLYPWFVHVKHAEQV